MSDALCVASSLFGEWQCGPCYVISMGSVVGIIASDIILTIFITISVFCFVTHQWRRKEWESHDGEEKKCQRISLPGNHYSNLNLHGVQSDVYSELRHFRKS
uniref:TYRO protein tyrosine kinase-binding protein n=1 Tax=Mola mola TaxID=94237 RepID=A0A3Q3VR59_MOLML